MLDRRLITEQTDLVRAALTLRHADDATNRSIDRLDARGVGAESGVDLGDTTLLKLLHQASRRRRRLRKHEHARSVLVKPMARRGHGVLRRAIGLTRTLRACSCLRRRRRRRLA